MLILYGIPVSSHPITQHKSAKNSQPGEAGLRMIRVCMYVFMCVFMCMCDSHPSYASQIF